MRYELSVEIERPPDEVFDYLSDPRNLPEWQKEVKEVRVESPDRFVEVRTFLGQEIESTLRVIAAEPGREFSIESVSGPVPFSVRHLLESVGPGRTRLTVIGEAHPGGFVEFAAGPARRVVERRSRANFARLKEALEARSL